MLHIYRQITSLRRVRPVVIAQKRENADKFPFARLDLVRKTPGHFLRRFWTRQLRDTPWQLTRAETAQLICVLTREKAELLHIYFGHIAVHLLPLIRHWPQPSIVSFHGADVGVDLEKRAYREATLEMLSAVRRVLVRSESLRDALAAIGCEESRIVVQRTGIPLEEFAFRQRTAPADGQWRLLQACRLIEKKGLATTLRAFAQFRRNFPGATLTIAGDGPLRSELEELARELQLGDAVRFTGFISQAELRDLLYSSHAFFHPSETGSDGNQEGVPNSILEAMASGLPVFATRHGGIPEVVENGRTGFLVSERDFTSLAQRLIEAVSNPEELFALGRMGSEAVAREFDQREQTRRLEEIYLSEMNHRSA
ncbi:MAG: glycosyltransferase [Verrucomicrobia bacterium]|nr:glycosyltransferase [Verrucomicrobiota bacterium]